MRSSFVAVSVVCLLGCGRSAANGTADAGDAAAAITEPAPLIHARVHEIVPAPVDNGGTLHFVTTGVDSRLCAVSDQGVHCRPLIGARTAAEETFRSSTSIADTREVIPYHVVVRRSVDKDGQLLVNEGDQKRVLFASDDEILAATRDYGVIDLVVRSTTMEGVRFTLHHLADTSGREESSGWKIDLPVGARMYWFYPWLVWNRPNSDNKSSRIFAMRGDQRAGEPAPPISELGPIDDWLFDAHLACRTSRGITVAAGRGRLHVLAERGGVWSLATRGTLDDRKLVGPDLGFDHRVRFDCSEDGVVASVTQRGPSVKEKPWSYQLHQLTCTAAGCEEWSHAFEPPDASPFSTRSDFRDPSPVLGRIGGTRVLLWETPSGIRLRAGDIEHGNGAPLFPARVKNARLFGSANQGYLLADDGADHVVGVRIAKDGTTAPIPPPKQLQ